MPKITKKQLETEILPGMGVTSKPSYEAYGRAVHAYLSPPSMMTRGDLEKLLVEAGCVVNAQYNPSGAAVEITNIAFFKAKGWDE